jgi:hypothetical protein
MSDTLITELENALAQAHLDHATEKRDLQHKLTESLKEVAKLEEDVARVLLDKSHDNRTFARTEVEQNNIIAQLTRENDRLNTELSKMQKLLDNTNEENDNLKREARVMQELLTAHTRELDNTKEENDNLKREALVMKTQLEEQDRSLAEAFGRLELPENRDPPAKEPEIRFNPRPSGGLDWDIESSLRQDRDLFSRAEARYVDFPRSSGPARSSGHARTDFSRRGDSSRRN